MRSDLLVTAGKEFACNAEDLGWEDPLEKGIATHSSILAWRIPMTGYSPWGLSQTRLSIKHSTAQEVRSSDWEEMRGPKLQEHEEDLKSRKGKGADCRSPV